MRNNELSFGKQLWNTGRKKQQQNQAKLQTQQEKGKDKNIQRKQTQKL